MTEPDATPAEQTPISSSATPSPAIEADTDIVTRLETENFIDTYQLVAEWIRFADAKAAAVLTACGALAGVLIPDLRDFLEAKTHVTEWWIYVVCVLFALWLITLLASSWNAFRCILPYRKDGEHPSIGKCNHFHPAAIAREYALAESDRFTEDASRLEPEELMRQVMAGLHLDAHISAAKYDRVSESIRLLGWNAVFAILYLVAAQL